MSTDFEFDERVIAYECDLNMVNGKSATVVREEGTRIYRDGGSDIEFRLWMKDVHKAFKGELVPFEWVADYVGVSRAAIHKRMKRGGLTVLIYEIRDQVSGLLGGRRERMRQEYKYVPLTECESWRNLHYDEVNAKFEAERRRKHHGKD